MSPSKMCFNAFGKKLPVSSRFARSNHLPATVLKPLPRTPPTRPSKGAAALNTPPVTAPIRAPSTPACTSPSLQELRVTALDTSLPSTPPAAPLSAPIPIAPTTLAPGPRRPTLAPDTAPLAAACNSSPPEGGLPVVIKDVAVVTATPITAPAIAPTSIVAQGQKCPVGSVRPSGLLPT